MKRTTIKDLAKYLRLSTSTVSRALAGDKQIHPDTRKKIFEAADKLGYRRNQLAAYFRSGRSGSVGIVVNEMITPFLAHALRLMQDEMQKSAINLLVACSYNDTLQEQRNILAMGKAQVDGLIIIPCHSTDNLPLFQSLVDSALPILFFGRNPGVKNVDELIIKDFDKAFFLFDHIVRSGRRNLALVNGDVETPLFREIERAYRACLEERGLNLNPNLILSAPPTFEGGMNAAAALLEKEEKVDAIIGATDMQAVGAMNMLLTRGIKVPQQIALAGYAGTSISRFLYPRLTTVEPPLDEMGLAAAKMLLERIENPNLEPRTLEIDAKICLFPSSHPEGCETSSPEYP